MKLDLDELLLEVVRLRRLIDWLDKQGGLGLGTHDTLRRALKGEFPDWILK